MSAQRFTLLIISVFAAAGISPDCAARISFLTGRNYPSGEQPFAAVVQDFNNDGVSDIASVGGEEVSVFLNNGDGTFGPANTFAVGAPVYQIASADLNGDGNADLVVTDDSQSAYIVLGNGDGTFGSPSSILLHESPSGIAIADLNGDGILDLAIAIAAGLHGEAAILIGAGDGGFAPPVYYGVAYNGVRLVATDLNHDGKLDLAVAVNNYSPRHALAILLGNGDGTFQPVVTSVLGSSIDIAAADLNGDGNVDLALVAPLGSQVLVVLGNGDGTFQPATAYPSDEVRLTVATADLSRDGVPDLVVGGDHVVIFLGNGDGTFGPPVTYGVGHYFARIGYFNADRDPDVVAATAAGGNFNAIVVAFGKRDGTLRAPIAYDLKPTGFVSADFDGDGHADVVVASDVLLFLRGLGDGTFATGVPIAGFGSDHMVATDFNGDGKVDLLSGGIDTRLGNGDGTFQAAQHTSLPFNYPEPAVADFNKDGRVDVAVTSVVADQFAILLGKGDGTFEAPTYYPTPTDFSYSPTPADFNGDGNPDLAICVQLSNMVSIYLGNGDGTFASPLPVATVYPRYSSVGDLNQDGKLDLLVAGGSESAGDVYLKLFPGNGDGTFQSAQTLYSDYGRVEVADLDRDGHLDVAIAPLYVSRGLVVLRGRGDGSFGAVGEFPTGQSLSNWFFVLSDLNGDAKPEAIVQAGIDKDFTVLLNTSPPRR